MGLLTDCDNLMDSIVIIAALDGRMSVLSSARREGSSCAFYRIIDIDPISHKPNYKWTKFKVKNGNWEVDLEPLTRINGLTLLEHMKMKLSVMVHGQ